MEVDHWENDSPIVLIINYMIFHFQICVLEQLKYLDSDI